MTKSNNSARLHWMGWCVRLSTCPYFRGVRRDYKRATGLVCRSPAGVISHGAFNWKSFGKPIHIQSFRGQYTHPPSYPESHFIRAWRWCCRWIHQVSTSNGRRGRSKEGKHEKKYIRSKASTISRQSKRTTTTHLAGRDCVILAARFWSRAKTWSDGCEIAQILYVEKPSLRDLKVTNLRDRLGWLLPR
jgi:hypothetical protein